jgi:single-strand DNA-binding protein
MSKGTNLVLLLGNLGKDPEIRATASGTLVANVTLATNERRKGQDGEWFDHTEWHTLVAFARLAEVFRDYTEKGSQVFVEGKLQTRSWDDKEGQRRYRTEVLVNQLSLLSAAGTNREAPQARDPAAPATANASDLGITDDDIPF